MGMGERQAAGADGSLKIETGEQAAGASGLLELETGEQAAGAGGPLELETREQAAGASGPLELETREQAAGASGPLELETGEPEGDDGEPTGELEPFPGEEPEPSTPIEQTETSPPAPAEAKADRAAEVFLMLARKLPTERRGFREFLARWHQGPSPEERRAGVERLTCDLQAACASDAERWTVRVTNIGLGGLELAHPAELSRGSRLAVLPEGYTQPVTGRVVWVRPATGHFRVGMRYDQDLRTLSASWVAQAMLDLGSEYLLHRVPRRFVRVETRIPSSLVLDDGSVIDIVLRDVSLGGCLLQSRVPFQVNEITLGLGQVGCRGLIVNARQEGDGWLHHVRFLPMSRKEASSLRRTISLLMRNGD
jgi:hypothetical protein